MSREETDATVFMGYDGPFKLWLDGVQIFEDLEGPEPLMIDEHKVCIYLSKGMHSIVAALDFQSGKGWGCVLRISCSMKDAAHPVPND